MTVCYTTCHLGDLVFMMSQLLSYLIYRIQAVLANTTGFLRPRHTAEIILNPVYSHQSLKHKFSENPFSILHVVVGGLKQRDAVRLQS